MPENITLHDLENHLDFFKRMYDVVRLVDPVQKQVLECRGNGIGPVDPACHAYWENGHICENCISIRAYREQKSFIKLDQTPENILVVTALPIESAERPVVMELLKNATDSILVGSGLYEKGQQLRDAVRGLNDLIIRDALTSLYNRRFLDERLPADIVNASIRRQPLSILFIDLDRMKSVNDTFGHTVGDAILRHAAGVIRRCIRSEKDWAARYGGDEFLICLHGADTKTAKRVAARIRQGFYEAMFSAPGRKIRVTASLGIATQVDTRYTAEELIQLADRDMYEMKRSEKQKP